MDTNEVGWAVQLTGFEVGVDCSGTGNGMDVWMYGCMDIWLGAWGF